MNIFNTVLSVILLLLYMRPNSAADVASYQHSSESSEECRTYCYKVVKPLLQYFHISSANQERIHKQEIEYKEQLINHRFMVNQFQAKFEQQELTIKHLQEQQEVLKKSDKLKDSLISHKDKRIADLAKKLEASAEAQKDTLKESEQLQAKIHKLQFNLEVQLEVKRVLLSEKDNSIADLKEQLNNVNKNKQFEEKPIKYVDPAKGPFSCVPYGNSIGIQTLRLPGAEAFEVSCDSRYDAEGWAVIQLRVNGFVNFNRTWDEYKNGFGDLRSEFWLGLEKLHLMTKFQPHELFIQLEDFNKKTRWARYSNFSIGSEAESYELLSLGEYTGNAGNALDTGNEFTAKNMKFSTPDRDNDNLGANCAAHFASGWWFNKCYYCTPNGIYVKTKTDEEYYQSIKWITWHKKPLRFVQMMIKPNKCVLK